LQAEPVRIAAFNVSLGRKGPGILLRDLEKGGDKQILAVEQIILKVAPDVLFLSDFDFDFNHIALQKFANQLAEQGLNYRFRFALPPNSGLATRVDLNGDGRLGGAGDAQGFGRFFGAGAMALLSRFPIDETAVEDFSTLLWKDLPGAALPLVNSRPYPSAKAQDIQRLSSVGHWDVPVKLPDGRVLHLFASNPTPPVFDGPEDQNGLRNADEIRFWSLYLNGLQAGEFFVIVGDLNADPLDGEGAHDEIARLLRDPRVRDVRPQSRGAVIAAKTQRGANEHHKTAAKFDTVDWRDGAGQPGNMRVDYVVASNTLKVLKSGVFWPAPDEDGSKLVGSDRRIGSHHRLVWIDIK